MSKQDIQKLKQKNNNMHETCMKITKKKTKDT